jgi:hypothetical protein
MKMKYLLLLLTSCTLLPKAAVNVKLDDYSVKKKVLVLDFFNDSPFGGEQLASFLTGDIKKFLTAFASRSMVETDSTFPTSKDIYGGGGLQLRQLSKISQDKGFHLIVLGRIKDFKFKESMDEYGIFRRSKFLGELFVEVKVIDVLQGQEVFSRVYSKIIEDKKMLYFFSKNNNLAATRTSIFKRMAHTLVGTMTELSELVSKMEWMGRVVKVMGNKYYIDAGRKSRLYIGDILQVITKGEEILDPENGSIIGLTKGEIKATLEVIDYNGDDQAVAVIYSGVVVLEGDLVQLYNN